MKWRHGGMHVERVPCMWEFSWVRVGSLLFILLFVLCIHFPCMRHHLEASHPCRAPHVTRAWDHVSLMHAISNCHACIQHDTQTQNFMGSPPVLSKYACIIPYPCMCLKTVWICCMSHASHMEPYQKLLKIHACCMQYHHWIWNSKRNPKLVSKSPHNKMHAWKLN